MERRFLTLSFSIRGGIACSVLTLGGPVSRTGEQIVRE
jgi:hypothetical protein